MFPVQAPLPVSTNAPALAFFTFLRSFAGVLYPPDLILFILLTFVSGLGRHNWWCNFTKWTQATSSSGFYLPLPTGHRNRLFCHTTDNIASRTPEISSPTSFCGKSPIDMEGVSWSVRGWVTNCFFDGSLASSFSYR